MTLVLVSAQAQPVITEFMAVNGGAWLDENGDASDWIEIQNLGPTASSLEGWFLTDDRANLTKWRFPATNLPAGAYLVVYASGKNRSVPGAPLHTSFALSALEGYLALVQPDGVTVASQFTYGQQFAEISFGVGLGPSRDPEPLLGPGAPLQSLIPSAPVPESWRGGAPFDDSAWSPGAMPAGFDVNFGPPTVAYAVPTNTAGNQAYGGALGLDFDITEPVQVTELGCFDDTGNGLGLTITVALWRRNNAGTPGTPNDDTGAGIVVSTNFTSAAPGTLLGGQRFKPLATPLTLTNGSYTIVAYGYGSAERLANNLGVVTPNSGAALQFVGRSRWGDNTALFPNVVDANIAQYAAGTFKFRTFPASDFGADLSAMQGANASALLRVPFTVPAGASWASLALNVAYDDGFVAWLNGVEIARRNAPAVLDFDSAATSAASARESLDVSGQGSLLAPGTTNILALQALNASAADGDLRLEAVLTAERFTTNAVYFATSTPGTDNAAGLRFPRPVIHEIHSDPLNSKSVPAEFIELYNPLPTPVDVSGWSFTRGLTWTFAPGTSIAGHGYLVLAESPSVFQQRFGGSALGPWEGSLANEGETLELVDANGVTVDEVRYGLGFPWPTVGDNDYSMQLIHEGLDNDLGGSWRSGAPTPGARNGVSAGNAPPQIRQVDHAPPQPAGGQVVGVTAKVTDPDGVSSVMLEYQIVEPGSYVRLADAAYTNNWIALPMHDDGLGGDSLAGDSVFTAQLPAEVQIHRRLVRYRMVATDAHGQVVTVPYADDPSPNFAYFVYDGVPAWTGAVQPGVTPAATFETNTMRQVRAYHLLSQSNDVWNCQYNAAFNDGTYRFEGALVVDGKVYDHVRYRVKGQNSTFNTGKNKWKVRFNRGHWFEMPDDYGLATTTIESLNVSSLPASWAPWNRGLAGLDEVMQYRLSNLAGVPAPRTAYFQLRVIDDPVEQPAHTQYDGDFWGLYIAFENQDNRFKDAHGLPDGNIFRMQITGAGNHLLGQGAGQPTDLSDLRAFVGTNGYNRVLTQPESWWRTHVDLLRYFSWRAVNEAVNNTDIRDQENVVYYRDPGTGQWHLEPWDCDLLYEQFDRWGPEGTQTTAQGIAAYEQIRRCLQVTNINIEFQNRARELLDLLINPDQTGKLLDEYLAIITDGGPTQPGFVEADRRRWDYNPINPVPPRGAGAFGNYYKTPYPIPDMTRGPYPQPYYRVLASPDFAGFVTWIKNFIPTDAHGGGRLANLASDPTIPSTPIITYVGAPDYPADGLVFEATPFASPTNRGFAAMQWRLAEVSYPGLPSYVMGTPYRYEIEETWTSGELGMFSSRVTVPPQFVREGRTYRTRVRFQDDSGRWSRWSAPVQFLCGTPGVARLGQSLIVSELMYNPPALDGVSGDEFEFLELRNVGTNTLDLSGLTFTDGISFTFTNGTQLAPGAHWLLVRNPARFAAKYPGVTVNGVYGGKLDNGGETLTLAHPVGGRIFSFTYDDTAPWPVTPDNLGFSLVAADPTAPFDLENSANWRASTAPGGSPGADDAPGVLAPIAINEVLSHSETGVDFIELFNPTTDVVNLGGWFLTDDPGVPMKFRIPADIVIGPLGFVVFTEADFNPTPGTNNSFALNGRGDDVYLFSGDAGTNLTGYSHGFAFGAAADLMSFGRYVISTGEEQFPAQLAATPGAPNAGPAVGPLVVNEIMYHPPPGGDEFIELKNITTNAVPLSDPLFPTNTWRLGGLGFTFPTNLVLGPGKLLLLVATNPATFRARYSVPSNVEILGPYGGILQDSGERLELQRPDAPDTNGLAYITVDEVRYNDRSPWPAGAPDGNGASLQRLNASAYGNDPANWTGANPTPGSEYLGGQAPSILVQPRSQVVYRGQTASFSLIATGAPPLSYQWRFNGGVIADAEGPTLVFSNAQPAYAGQYSAVVLNQAGSAASAVALLTVTQPPSIQSQPTNQFVRPGSNAVFRVAAVGLGLLRYEWRWNGVPLPGEAGATLTLANAQFAQEGLYTVRVSDSQGSALSAPASLVILVDPLITQQPLGQEVAAGETVTLSVSVSNTATLPMGYRWRRNGANIPGSFFVLNERTCFLTLTNVQLPYTNYSVVVSNAARTGGIGSSSALLKFVADNDADGLPDAWETRYGFPTNSAANAAEDVDGDALSNAQEYVAGTDPTDRLSYLRLDIVSASGVATVLFGAVSNRTYSLQCTDALGSGAWNRLTDVLARPTNRVETIADSGHGSNRFYRVVTPRLPQ